MNRLEDSFILWKSVIENKLLAHVSIVLFLNKCDLLKKKLENGVRLSRHMPSYRHTNDYATVSQCASSCALGSLLLGRLTDVCQISGPGSGRCMRGSPRIGRESSIVSDYARFFVRSCIYPVPTSPPDVCHRYPENTYDHIQR